jgi:PPOX class probable F420-dependent enzyme
MIHIVNIDTAVKPPADRAQPPLAGSLPALGRRAGPRLNRTVSAIGIVTGHDRATIPASHLDLVDCPPVAALTTVTERGEPQTSVVWCDFDGECVRVNTMRGFAKERNMRRNPRVTVLCYDPAEPNRYLEVRGRVIEMTEDGAGRHLDAIASRYAGRPVRYFGDVIPVAFAETEIPVLCRIRPTRVVAVDATASRVRP